MAARLTRYLPEFRAWMDAALTRPQDRALFGL
jgi:hypothetical protein